MSAVNSVDTRYHYMDNLRALAMLLGIFFHAALAFSPLLHNLWFLADRQQNIGIDVVVFWLHTFRMPLFFLIAGFFALMLLEKKGIKGFIKNRSVRIILPFFIFLPLVFGLIIIAFLWIMENVQHLPPVIQLSKDMPNRDTSVGTGHLWFLFNLFGFCLLFSGAYKLNWLRKSWLKPIASIPFLLIVFPLLIVPALFSVAAPFPPPDKLYPELWSYGFYGVFFLVGMAIFKHVNVVEELYSYRYWIGFMGAVCYIAFFQWLPNTITLEEVKTQITQGAIVNYGVAHFVLVFVQSFCAVYFSLLALVIGYKFLNKQSTNVRYVADSSYWLYIVHIPLLFAIQTPLIDLSFHWSIKLFIALCFTLLVGLSSYHVIVRRTWVGAMLNGKRYKALNSGNATVDEQA